MDAASNTFTDITTTLSTSTNINRTLDTSSELNTDSKISGNQNTTSTTPTDPINDPHENETIRTSSFKKFVVYIELLMLVIIVIFACVPLGMLIYM